MEKSFGEQRVGRFNEGKSQKANELGEPTTEGEVGFSRLQGELSELLANVVSFQGASLNDVLEGSSERSGDEMAIAGSKRRGEAAEENLQPHAGGDVAGGADKVKETVNEKKNVKRGRGIKLLREISKK